MTAARRAKSVNFRAILVVMVTAALAMTVVVCVHRFQVDRNAGSLTRLAHAKLKEGNRDDALGLFSRYLAYRPEDAATHAEFARLMIEFAERPTASKNDRAYAYRALETAVRLNPDDLPLRERLATWMLRFGRFGDADRELKLLRDRITESPSAKNAPEAPDLDTVDLMRARALVGRRDFNAAAEIVASIVGFDLTTQSFLESPSRTIDRDILREASVLLTTLLAEKLRAPATATSVLARLVESNPDDVQAWLALARWHQSTGDLVRAASAVRTAAKIAPEDPGVLFTDLELCIAEKRYDSAELLANKARALFPEDDRSYVGLAAVAFERRDLEKTIDVLREGLDLFPEQPTLLGMLAESLLQANRLEEAEETIRTLTESAGDTRPTVGILQARLLMAQNRWLPARLKLEAVRPLVAESDQTTRQVDLLLGQCHERLGQYDEQLAANQRVLLGDAGSLQARIGSANALAASGKPDAALAEFEGIAASLPDDDLPNVRQVWTPLLQLRVAGQLKRPPADRDWSQVEKLIDSLERSPAISSAELALLRSDLLVRQGDSAAAFGLLRNSVDASPGNVQSQAALALLCLREQGFSAAEEVLDKVPAKIVNDPVLLNVRAQLASRAPPEESAEILSRLEKKAEELPTAQAVRLLSTIATVHRSLGDREQADRVWRHAMELDPEDLMIRTALFELACEQGNVQTAQEAAEAISRLSGPTSPQSRVANAATLVLEVRVAQAAKSVAGNVGEPTLSTEELATLEAAKNLLIEAENDRPGWARIQQVLAEIARLQGELPTAIERLQQAVLLGPVNPEVIRQLVSLLYRCDRLKEARDALSLVGPDGLNGLERVSAEIDVKMGQFDAAVAMAERSLAGNIRNTASDLRWFGQLLARVGKVDRAEEVLRESLEADPHSTESWMALLLVQRAAERFQDAERTMEKAAKILPPPQRRLFTAQSQELLGRIDDAERSFREAVEEDPADASAAQNLSAFLVRHGRLTEARQALETLIAIPGDDGTTTRAHIWARRTLAELTAQSGRYPDLERALDLLDANADAKGRVPPEDIAIQAALLASRPEPASWQRAFDLLEKLAMRQPLTNAQRLEKARLLGQLGRWEDCRDELLTIASAPNTPPNLYALLIGQLLDHKETESARIWLKSMEQRFPDTPLATALEAKLAIAQNDRAGAVAAARKLMPSETATRSMADQLGVVSALLENLGLNAAADEVFARFATVSSDGVIARAEFLGRSQRADEALDLLEHSWDKLPLEKLLRAGVGVLLAQDTGVTERQVTRLGGWFEKARRDDPDSPSLALLWADFIGTTGSTAEAIAAYRDLLARKDLQPEVAAMAANNLAFYLAEPETVEEARILIDRALAELGPHPDILDTRGIVSLAAGQGKEAVADLKESLLVPSAAKYLHLAAALASQEQLREARDALAKAKELGLLPQRLSSAERRHLENLETKLVQ